MSPKMHRGGQSAGRVRKSRAPRQRSCTPGRPRGVSWKGVAAGGKAQAGAPADGTRPAVGGGMAGCQPLALSRWPLLSASLARRSWRPSQKAAGSPCTGVSHPRRHLCPLGWRERGQALPSSLEPDCSARRALAGGLGVRWERGGPLGSVGLYRQVPGP